MRTAGHIGVTVWNKSWPWRRLWEVLHGHGAGLPGEGWVLWGTGWAVVRGRVHGRVTCEVCSEVPSVTEGAEASKLDYHGLQWWIAPLADEDMLGRNRIAQCRAGYTQAHPNPSETTTTTMGSRLISSAQPLMDKRQHPRCPPSRLSRCLRAPALHSYSWWPPGKPVEPAPSEELNAPSAGDTGPRGSCRKGQVKFNHRARWPGGLTYRHISTLYRYSYFSLPLEIRCKSIRNSGL